MSEVTISKLVAPRADRPGEISGTSTDMALDLAAAKRRIRQLETELAVSRKVNEVFLEQGLPQKALPGDRVLDRAGKQRPRRRFGGSFSPARSSTSTAILRGSTVRTASPQSFRFGRQIVVGHNAVASIMHELGIKGLPKRRMPRSARVGAVAGADLVRRQFTRAAPDQLWMTDITEHPTREGKIYCCVVLDAFSRRVVGWPIDSSQTTVLVMPQATRTRSAGSSLGRMRRYTASRNR